MAFSFKIVQGFIFSKYLIEVEIRLQRMGPLYVIFSEGSSFYFLFKFSVGT